ncbi:MAG TPA: hypothetical protein VH985_22845, partial [Candidatus Binatia bacterium]
YDESFCTAFGRSSECILQIIGTWHLQSLNPHAQRSGGSLSLSKMRLNGSIRTAVLNEMGNSRKFWECFLEKLQAFAGQVRKHVDDTGDVCTGLRETGDQALPDWVVAGIAHDDRNRAGCVLGGAGGGYPNGENEINSQTDNIVGQVGILVVTFRESVFNEQVLSFDIAQLPKTLTEGFIDKSWGKVAYTINFAGLLRAGHICTEGECETDGK